MAYLCGYSTESGERIVVDSLHLDRFDRLLEYLDFTDVLLEAMRIMIESDHSYQKEHLLDIIADIRARRFFDRDLLQREIEFRRVFYDATK